MFALFSITARLSYRTTTICSACKCSKEPDAWVMGVQETAPHMTRYRKCAADSYEASRPWKQSGCPGSHLHLATGQLHLRGVPGLVVPVGGWGSENEVGSKPVMPQSCSVVSIPRLPQRPGAAGCLGGCSLSCVVLRLCANRDGYDASLLIRTGKAWRACPQAEHVTVTRQGTFPDGWVGGEHAVAVCFT
jgi:hypothetical protein